MLCCDENLQATLSKKYHVMIDFKGSFKTKNLKSGGKFVTNFAAKKIENFVLCS